MAVAVLSGFVLALAAPWIQRNGRGLGGWIIALLPLGLTIYLASLIGPVADGETLRTTYRWVPSLGIHLSFYVDGLSLLFALLISGIGTLIFVYAGSYLAGHHHLGRLYAFLLTFMASMLGLVLADNIITLFVFWELTSISSYLLIGFDHERTAARGAALQSLLVTGLGGQVLLAGLILLALGGGSFELSVLLERGDEVRAHALYLPILLLIAVGAFTKSAQFPFHFWLPSAMEAPTPVSAYLHSATMVKAGIYLLARLNPVLGGTQTWLYLLAIVGTVTMLVGAFLAFQQTDLKRILAYTTVSALGILVSPIGLGTTTTITAMAAFLVAHSLYKGALFLVAGAVDHETGTRDVERLGGLRRSMPILTVATGLAALSLAGFPPLFGFIGKELILEGALEEAFASPLMTIAIVVSAGLLVAVAGVVGLRPFTGPERETPKHPHEAPLGLWLGPLLLAVLGLVFGVLPRGVADWLVAPAVAAVYGAPVEVYLALWHGINTALILSGVAIVAGAAIYVQRDPLHRLALRLTPIGKWGPDRGYDLGVDALNWVARVQTRLLQSGYLRVYVQFIIVTATGLVGFTLVNRGGWQDASLPLANLRYYELALGVLILLAALVAVRTESRLAAVAALGVVGFAVALVYVLFGAPDLAMTQILIDTLTVVLFVLVLYRLPRFAERSTPPAHFRDALMALTAGGLMTVLVLVATSVESAGDVSRYFAQQSVPEAHGRNVVNVILVDFRAMDTLGEITVLAVAGLGVFALMKLYYGREESQVRPSSSSPRPMPIVSSLILRTATIFLMPLLLLFSVFLLLRGHDLPGGGFAGGLVGAAAFALYAIAYDVASARRLLRADPHALVGAGLLFALGSGIFGLLLGHAFLTGEWVDVPVPGFGDVPLGTPLLFDIGVYLVVLGTTLMIILTLSEE